MKMHQRCIGCSSFLFMLSLFPNLNIYGSNACSRCEVIKPDELDVIYDSKVEIFVKYRKQSISHPNLITDNYRDKIAINLDGVVVGEAVCPSQFTLRGLQPGMHLLSISVVTSNESLRSRCKGQADILAYNRTFFVAHEMFRPGRPWSPPTPPESFAIGNTISDDTKDADSLCSLGVESDGIDSF